MTAEKEALTKAYAKKCSDDADTIMALSEQIDVLKNDPLPTDSTDPCVVAEETYKKAASQVMYGRKKANNLILGINDMVQAIEEELSYLQANRETDETRDNTSVQEDKPERTEPAILDDVQRHMDIPLATTAVQAGDEATVHSDEQEEEAMPTEDDNASTYQRTFRPRSQTMDTIVKKASMFLRANNGSKKNDSKKARPQSTALPIRDLTQPKLVTSENPKVGTSKRQMFRRMSSQALSSYYQSTPLFNKSASTKNLTQKEAPMTLRQAIAAAEQARKQQNNASSPALVSSASIDGHDEITPSLPNQSTLMLHYQKQQQMLQNRVDDTSVDGSLDKQRRRRSAMISTCSSPLAGGAYPTPSTSTATNKSTEQWKISGRGR
ncbi:hypothetical protein BJV82DRAFT_105919 [Fennellomyces sp. T-0311]|nr:hypothetical protein BJV82DRAFT_105919 [Fennellomyces sp. T-0311]